MFLFVLPQSLLKFFPFSRECTHDLFDRCNHVKLCVGFLYFDISSLFLLVAHRSCVAFTAPPQQLVVGAVRITTYILYRPSFSQIKFTLVLLGGLVRKSANWGSKVTCFATMIFVSSFLRTI